MSWDIVLFNSSQKIEALEGLDDSHLEPIDFCSILEGHFVQIEKSDNHRTIKGPEFEIDFFCDTDKVSNIILSIYGENGFFEIVGLAQQMDWQIFDTGLGRMIDLKNPDKNGRENHIGYSKHISNMEDKPNDTL